MDLLLGFIIITVFLLLSFIYSGSEVSFFSISPIEKIKLTQESHKRGKLYSSYLNTPQKTLITILLGNMVVNLSASIVGQHLTQIIFARNQLFYSVFFMTLILLIFGEVVPKNVAASRPGTFGLRFIPVIHVTYKLFSPLVYFLSLVFTNKQAEATRTEALSTDELISAVEISSRTGIGETTIQVLKNLTQLIDKPVKELMVPRSDIQAIDIDKKWIEIEKSIQEMRYSEIIFYQQNIDNIIGYITVEKLVELKKKNLHSILREPLFVLESKSSLSLLTDFKAQNEILAVILDEYGGTAGIITLKELLDYIFIKDLLLREYIVEAGEGKWLINAEMPISDINDLFSLDLSPEFHTIGGYISSIAGEIPRRGSQFSLSNSYKVKVIKRSSKQIEQLELSKDD